MNNILFLIILSSLNNIIISGQIVINYNNKLNRALKNITFDNTIDIPEGFVPVDESNPYGPITVDKKRDNGKKRNLFEIVKHQSDDSFYYNYDEFNKLESELPQKSEYFCETYNKVRPEVQKGYEISCPTYYTIVIDKAFYGRYANDTTHCSKNINYTPENMRTIKNDCGYESLKIVKELCEGKIYCSIIPSNTFYKNRCGGLYKYLNVKYHCKKDIVSLNFLFEKCIYYYI